MKLEMQVNTTANWIWAPEMSLYASPRDIYGARLLEKTTSV